MTRSRRAGLSRDEVRRQPLYARMLGLQYLAPSGFLCFVFLEGAVALGILLALAELVSWWGVLVLPVTVAVMVKLNDVVAGALTRVPGVGRAGGATPFTSAGRSAVASLEGPAAGFAVPAAGFTGPGAAGFAGPAAGFPGPAAAGFAGSRFAPSGFSGSGSGLPGRVAAGGPLSDDRATGPRPVTGAESPGAETVRLPPSVIAQAGEAPPLRPATVPRFRDAGAGGPLAGAPAPGRGTGAEAGPTAELPPPAAAGNGPTSEPRQWRMGDDGSAPSFPQDGTADAGRFLGEVNSPRTAPPRADGLDDQQQRARQSAAWRYE